MYVLVKIASTKITKTLGAIFAKFLITFKSFLSRFLQLIVSIIFFPIKYLIRYSPLKTSDKIALFTKSSVLSVRNRFANSKYDKHNVVSEFPSLNYNVNCSGVINYVLQQQSSNAWKELENHIKITANNGSATIKPLCLYYYRFLQNKQNKFWETPNDGRSLQVGDLLVFSENVEKVTKNGQHIVMIAGIAQPIGGAWVKYSIYDSTGHGHGRSDMRGINGQTGIGEGDLAVQCSDDGTVVAIKWSLNSTKIMHPKIAIGRLKSKA